MSDRAAMLAACDASRDDRTPHLAFVDWREEHGELDTRQGLLERIWIEPDNDEWRLEYARELERNPRDESETPRAELIRVQCELARVNGTQDPECRRATKNNPRGDAHGYTIIKTNRPAPCVDCWKQLKDRERDLLARHEAEWRCPTVCERCGGKRKTESRWSDGVDPDTGDGFGNYEPGGLCTTCHGLGRIGVLNEQQWTRLETGITGFSHVVQPTVTWSRGFPRIECPVAWWCEEKYCCLRCDRIDGLDTLCAQCQGRAFKPDYPHARGCWEEQGFLILQLTDRATETCWLFDDIYGDGEEAEPISENIPTPIFDLAWDVAEPTKRHVSAEDRQRYIMCADQPEAARTANLAAATWARGLACGRGGVGV